MVLNSTDVRLWMKKTAWPNEVFLCGIMQSALAAPLVTLSIDLNLIKSTREGRAKPCIIL